MDATKYRFIICLLIISLMILLGFRRSEFLVYEDYTNDNLVEIEKRLYLGISKVNKTLNVNENYYSLIEGEKVIIKDFLGDDLIIIDDNDNEFIVNSDFIEIIKTKEHVTRGSVSRRIDSVTKIVKTAHDELGKPYIYGDTGKRGYDCSGLVYSIYLEELGIELPRSSNELVDIGREVNKSELVAGDILLFNTRGQRISHAGIYIGEGNMIHASSGERKVTISPVDSGYFNSRYVTARRVIQ